MRPFHQQIVFIGFLLEGIVCGQPSLRPSTFFSCTNEIVTYTCHDFQVSNIQWIVEPYISERDPITFSADQVHSSEGTKPMNRTQTFSATLVNITNSGDITTILTFNTSEVKNMTTIACRTQKGIEMFYNSTSLYIADVPYKKNAEVSYQYQKTYFTAVLQLADMFDGGGVQIDHYIILFDNGTVLNTTAPTFMVRVAYNVTVYANVSAYNCAGYSDPLILDIYKDNATEEDVPSSTSHTVAVPVTIVTAIIVVVIVITAALTISLYKCPRHTCHSNVVRSLDAENTLTKTGSLSIQTYPLPATHSTGCGHDSSINSNSGLVVNSTLEGNRTGSHLSPSVDEQEYHMDNNPLYHINLVAGHSTMKPQHEYETVDITGISSESTNRTEKHAT